MLALVATGFSGCAQKEQIEEESTKHGEAGHVHTTGEADTATGAHSAGDGHAHDTTASADTTKAHGKGDGHAH